MARLLALVLAVLILPAEAHAISRYNSTTMSCDRIRATIANEGAVILRYKSTRNPSLQLYGRYVANWRMCDSGETTEFAYVPSADRKSCPVLKCVVVDLDDEFILRPRGR
ncbi:MAG: hypothetical protein JNL61_17970 [Rhizobiaceae bacterium]|nr:hypothetical protein [Rhizobiaceae bacterium]